MEILLMNTYDLPTPLENEEKKYYSPIIGLVN